MLQAVKRFDTDRGFRITTYAMWWVRAAIQEYILRSWMYLDDEKTMLWRSDDPQIHSALGSQRPQTGLSVQPNRYNIPQNPRSKLGLASY